MGAGKATTSGPLLSFGRDGTGALRHVLTVPSGLACNCVCPDCGSPLIGRRGKMVAHFAHHAGGACKSGGETALHELGKEVLYAAEALMLPPPPGETSRSIFEYDEAVLEQSWHDEVNLIRPDVVIRHGHRALFVEVKVTHGCPDEKLSWLTRNRQQAIEVDLSSWRRRLFSRRDIALAVLLKAPRRWLYHSEKTSGKVDREVVRTALYDLAAKTIHSQRNAWMRKSHPGAEFAPLIERAGLTRIFNPRPGSWLSLSYPSVGAFILIECSRRPFEILTAECLVALLTNRDGIKQEWNNGLPSEPSPLEEIEEIRFHLEKLGYLNGWAPTRWALRDVRALKT